MHLMKEERESERPLLSIRNRRQRQRHGIRKKKIEIGMMKSYEENKHDFEFEKT